MAKRLVIPFFTDNCVPDSVGNALMQEGHTVRRLRDSMPVDSPDPVVEAACFEHHLVLVTDDRDFKQLAKRLSVTKRRYRGLHRIDLHCAAPIQARRISETISLIEHEWWRIQAGQPGPMVIAIRDTSIWIPR